MTRIPVEFPIEEAEAIIKRLREVQMSAADCNAAMAGCERVERALNIERGPGGAAEAPIQGLRDLHSHERTCDLYAEACSLTGRGVRIRTTYGSEKIGRLDHVRGFATLVLLTAPNSRQPIPLSQVVEIEAEPEAVAA